MEEPMSLRILLIEDNPGDARLVQTQLAEALGPAVALDVVARLRDGLDRLRRDRFDAVLLDLELPDSQGLQTLDRVLDQAPAAPVVVLTGLDDERLGLEAVQRGAQEYLVKGPISSRSLGRVICYSVERKKAAEALGASVRDWHATFDAIADPVWLADADGTIQRCNKAVVTFLGRPLSEIIGQRCCSVVHGLSEPIAECPLVRMCGSRQRETLELQIGGRWLHIVCHPLLDECGEVTRAVHVTTDITERKWAEEALRASETRYRVLVENVNDVIYALDSQGRFTYVSPVVEAVTGYKPQELVGRQIARLVHPDDLPAVLSGLDEVLGGKSEPHEFRLLSKNGEVQFVRVFSRLIFEGGQPAGLTGVLTDITQRKKAEEGLRSLEQRYRTIVETANEAIWMLDTDYRISYVNPKMTELLGYSPEEMVGESNLLFIHPEMRKRILEYRTERLQGHTGTYENRLLRKDGGVVATLSSVSPFFDDARRFLGVVAIHTDITERKRAEEALRESEERFRATFEQSAVGVTHVDLEGKWLRVNQTFCDLVGYTREELLHRSFTDITHPDDIARGRDDVKNLIAGQVRTTSKEKRYIRKDGSAIWVNLTSSLARGPEGEPEYLIAVSEDITERKQAEESLKRAVQRLEETLDGTIRALSSVVDMRDPYTAGHQRRVAELACAIAGQMGLSDEQIEGIRSAALVHDIGKVAVPLEILSIPRPLSSVEFDFIRSHAQAGYDILKAIEFPWPLAQIVLQHHERMDGSGYPSGLTAGNILVEARILAVADVVEAMISHRPYRPALGELRALEEVSKGAGVLYDAKVVAACLTLFTEKGFQFE
ncbi:MAG: PAS domain S-box protein [Chloroflexi bacterium]|nr:PAS domain S-box protein [Chloroflexota bacterium]